MSTAPQVESPVYPDILGKMTRNGQKRTKMVVRSWRSGSGMNTYLLRCVSSASCPTKGLLTVNMADRENWLSGRCYGVRRSRGAESILLFGARSQSSCILVDIFALQGIYSISILRSTTKHIINLDQTDLKGTAGVSTRVWVIGVDRCIIVELICFPRS